MSSVQRNASSSSPPGSRSCATSSAIEKPSASSPKRSCIALITALTAAGSRAATATAPASVLCASLLDTTLTMTAAPGSDASSASSTSAARAAYTTAGTAMPQAERMARPSGSIRAERPAARAAPRIPRMAPRSGGGWREVTRTGCATGGRRAAPECISLSAARLVPPPAGGAPGSSCVGRPACGGSPHRSQGRSPGIGRPPTCRTDRCRRGTR